MFRLLLYSHLQAEPYVLYKLAMLYRVRNLVGFILFTGHRGP